MTGGGRGRGRAGGQRYLEEVDGDVAEVHRKLEQEACRELSRLEPEERDLNTRNTRRTKVGIPCILYTAPSAHTNVCTHCTALYFDIHHIIVQVKA